ncbi:MAG: cytochrome c [Bacteroidetes bacterium]|nr:cytochrome c [Bacteroidota bacterium]
MKNAILLTSAGAVLMAFLLMSFSAYQQKQPEPWPVPAEYKNMANPVKADEASVKLGAAAYARNCASCHGRTGLGDGPKGRALKTFSGDFSGAAYHNQTDGEHFYKTKFGRGEMPAYDKKISDTDMWHMVNYMRTFKK